MKRPDLTLWGREVALPRRLELRYSREQVAAMSGISAETIRNLEIGRSRFPHWETVREVCRVLDLPMPIAGPHDDRVVLCLHGTDADAVTRIITASLREFVRRRANPDRFADKLTPGRKPATKRALAALVAADRDLAQQILDTLPPKWLSAEAPSPTPSPEKGQP